MSLKLSVHRCQVTREVTVAARLVVGVGMLAAIAAMTTATRGQGQHTGGGA